MKAQLDGAKGAIEAHQLLLLEHAEKRHHRELRDWAKLSWNLPKASKILWVAAARGRLASFIMLRTNAVDCKWWVWAQEAPLIDAAAKGEHIEVMTWLHDNGSYGTDVGLVIESAKNE